MPHILIIEDEAELARFLTRLFTLKGYDITHVATGKDFDKLTRLSQFDAAFIDVRLPDRNGIELLKIMTKQAPNCPCIVMTGFSTVKLAVDAIKYGAVDFIEKPFEDIDALELLLEHVLSTRQSVAAQEYEKIAQKLGIFLGSSPEMHALYKLAYTIASKQITVLIEGETGSGKELLTQFIHAASHRAEGRLMAINCGALSETLLESELFGHVKGAFTGALHDRIGYFEASSSGTLFLDEIAEASLATQVKLLRVLESGEFTKIGGIYPEKTNARIIAASHTNLEHAVEKGAFREDLRFRLDVVKLELPPLRKRLVDLPYLVDAFITKYKATISFSAEAMSLMQTYAWHGNMRELANTVQQMAAILPDDTIVQPHHLSKKFYPPSSATIQTVETIEFLDEWNYFSDYVIHTYGQASSFPLEEMMESMKRMEKRTAKAFIEKALHHTAGNRERAAELLHISPRKLRYYLNEV